MKEFFPMNYILPKILIFRQKYQISTFLQLLQRYAMIILYEINVNHEIGSYFVKTVDLQGKNVFMNNLKLPKYLKVLQKVF